jgi:hypothetical protein
VETGYPKEEIQNEFEVIDLDLLIIDYVAIYPEFRGLRIAESAIHRTIGKQRRGHSEAEIILVTPRVLAARQHRNLFAEPIAKGLSRMFSGSHQEL